LGVSVATIKPVFWRQGMFLQPQHFQQSELHQANQANLVREYSHPWFWGFISYSMAKLSLQQRIVELDQAEIVFQDGTHVILGQNAYIQSRQLDNITIDPEVPLNVYISLRKMSSLESNVTVIQDATETSSVQTRYFTQASPHTVDDIYSDGPKAELQTLTHKLGIVFEHERDAYADYLLIPVAKIALEGENLVFPSEFLPPLITLAGTPEVQRLIKELRDELTGRAIQLSSNNSASQQSGSFDPNLLRYRIGLQTLSRYVPRLFHITETPNIHPWDVYGTLRELVGEISTFTQEVNFLGENKKGERLLPAYQHTNLGECFNSARNLISQLMNEISVGPQFLVELDYDGKYFSTEIPSEFFEQQVDFYLILNTEQSWDDHSQSFLTTAKLADSSTVEVLAERSLPGVGLYHMPSPPAGLPKKAFANYARIDIHDDKWQQIQSKQNLALMWDEAPSDLKVELVILRK
jgi:type VI secretion system protein ImpJ